MKFGVPFGQDKTTGEWKDVAEVERGLACGCICPSCGLRLSARHGDEREWHFSHHTRNIPKEEIVDCEYSFEVSLRMMALQLLSDGAGLTVPEYQIQVTIPLTLQHRFKPEVKCAKQMLLTANDAKLTVDADFMGHKVDVLYEFPEAFLIVYFVYQGRSFPIDKNLLRQMGAGAILLDLGVLSHHFYRDPLAEGGVLGTARAQLLGWLNTGTIAKCWKYHPREDGRLAEKHRLFDEALKEQKLADSLLSEDVGFGKRTVAAAEQSTKGSHIDPRKLVRCTCVCGKTFTGIKGMANACPICCTHLYVTHKRYIPSGFGG
uniref:Competence CoiA family protein n=1 Tax=Shewanella sp. (strain MR-7) TaxID=60481 RepID=Q0HSR2_SHESR